MNNQFFADRNDFFKYDLLLELMERSSFFKQLTFVPMLTPEDGRKGGNLKDYQCGSRRPALYRFLRECLENGHRDVRSLRDYFAPHRFTYTPYRDSSYFTDKHRQTYFRGIPDQALVEALVFIDPDNGLEVPSTRPSNGDKYLKYEELDDQFSRMNDPSVLVVYQHHPRVKRRELFRMIDGKLEQNFRTSPSRMLVSDNRIALLVLTKEAGTAKKVGRILDDYARRHGLVFVSATETRNN